MAFNLVSYRPGRLQINLHVRLRQVRPTVLKLDIVSILVPLRQRSTSHQPVGRRGDYRLHKGELHLSSFGTGRTGDA